MNSAGKLAKLSDYAPKLNQQHVQKNREKFQKKASLFGFHPDAQGDVSYAEAAKFFKKGNYQKNSSDKRFMEKELDQDGNGKINFSEMARTWTLMDAAGNGDGKTKLKEQRHAYALNNKHFILDEAIRLNIAPDERGNLETRLANNTFTTSQEEPSRTFDLSMANTSDPAAEHPRTEQAINRYESFPGTAKEQDIAKKNALRLFAYNGNMPMSLYSPNNDIRLGQVKAVETELPGGGRSFQRTGYKYTIDASGQMRKEDKKITLPRVDIKAPNDYKSDGSSIQAEMKGKVDQVLKDPEIKQSIHQLKSSVQAGSLSSAQGGKELETLLNPIQQGFAKAYGLGDVKLNVSNAKVKAGLTGGFDPESKTFTLYQQNIAKEHQANIKNLGQEKGTKKTVSDLVGTTAHELAHGDQANRMTAVKNGKTAAHSERIKDYQANKETYHIGYELTAMTGTDSGPEGPDQKYYEGQPLEADAHAIGEHAAKKTAKILK